MSLLEGVQLNVAKDEKWKVLMREDEHDKVEEWVAQVRGWIEPFLEKLRKRPPEDSFM
ncbi:hypothetical protein C2845_PM08G11620 [Panicum miliaceum]|uniref:Uncharacterized protein n=1 Tax=Panicum miliaceum TaxID=4540 RepID=A0A3L6QWV6_PANMI|nr:hypothetical protein C2845_PM08G11620 [Panicum miliaceum]